MKKINVKYIFLSLVLSLSVLTTVPAAETPVADNIEAEAWFNKSTESLDKGFWTDAVRYATVAIYYDQYFLPSFMNRAKAFIKLESFKDALLDCNYILREDPNNVEAIYHRGLAYILLGEKDKGLQDYQKACEMGYELSCKKHNEISKSLPPGRIQVLLQQSIEKFERMDFSGVIALSDEIIEMEPGNYEALSNRCGAYASLNNFSLALPDCKKAITINPDFSMAYNNLGYIFEKKGVPKEAIANFEKSCQLSNSLGCKNLRRINEQNR